MTVRHERVLAALELREPDRVPTMDMMVEYANIYEILGDTRPPHDTDGPDLRKQAGPKGDRLCRTCPILARAGKKSPT